MSTSFENSEPATEDFIPLCVPEIRGNEWKYIKECLDTNWVSSVGQYVDRFERGIAEYVGAKHAVATANGTAALHVALLIAGVQPDDEVLVSTLTFIAPANAIRYVGAWPVFVDAAPDCWQMDPQRVVHFLERGCRRSNNELRNKVTGRRIKAILPVHILGHPVELDTILEVARKYDLAVIEDATESLGAKYKGRMVGTLGDVACFSFNGNKIITTGGGGMIVTDNEAWADKARYLTTQAKDDPVEYIHNEIGYNYRLTNIQAAMGCAQLELLNDYIARKWAIARRYTKAFANIEGFSFMPGPNCHEDNAWMFTIRIDEKRCGETSRGIMKALGSQKIQTRPLWYPLHLLRPYKNCQVLGGQTASILYNCCLSLPCSVGLSVVDQEKVINAVLGVCTKSF